MSNEKTKRCPQCGTVKAVTEFGCDRSRRDGLAGKCKACDRAKAAAYYAANSGALNAKTTERNRAKAEELTEARAVMRRTAEAVYGGKCEWCSATEELELDHVDDDGGEHRQRECQVTYVRRIALTGARLSDVDLRLLCRPCHRGPGWQERRAAHAC